MDFEGHQLNTIDKCWVFDLTTFIGYHIILDENNKVKEYTKAFVAIRNNDNDSYSFDKKMIVPVKVLRKTVDIIKRYRKEALLDASW